MKTKIAVLMTSYLKPFVEAALKEAGDECDVTLRFYDSFKEIGEIYRTIPDDVRGVLTSGMFPARAIELTHPAHNRIIKPFNTDDAGFYHLMLQLMSHDRALDFSRVHVDFIDMLGLDVSTYIFWERKRSFAEPLAARVAAMDEEELYGIEEKVFQRHLSLYREGRSDISVTRFSSIVPRLQQAGVQVYFAYPSYEYLANVIKETVRDTRIMEMESSLPAAISVAARVPYDGASGASLATERRMLALHELLLDFSGMSAADCVIQRSMYGYEAYTTRRTVAEYTDGFSVCELSKMAKERLAFPVSIGYGVGLSMGQARMNAGNARREAEHSGAGSFVIDERGSLIGPLGAPEALAVEKPSEPRDFDEAKRAGLSPLTVQKIRAAAVRQPDGRLTAQNLSLQLAITSRSANRFLKALCESGVMLPDGENRPTTKGRPEKVYRFAEG